MVSLSAPRAPRAALPARLYESHFLTATHPDGDRAVWLRYTALKRPGEPAHASVWLTAFDRTDAPPRAIRVTAGEPLGDPGDGWSTSALGELRPGAARAELDGASWDLGWEARAPELPYLPARWLYDRAIPRSNGAALVPSATVSGTLTVDGAAVSLDRWEGSVGHNWGSDHADVWSWIHVPSLGEDRRGWLDLALARLQFGPVWTPWLAGGALNLDGRTLAPVPGARVRRQLDGSRTSVSMALRGGVKLEVDIDMPEPCTVRWDYASPSGGGRRVRNCLIADAIVTVRERGNVRSFEARGRVAIEHGAAAE